MMMKKSQKGIVLIVTLLMLVLIMLASAGMLRSTDTLLTAMTNLTLRQSAEASSNWAIEQVVRNFSAYTTPGAPGFFTSIQPNESTQGIPRNLQTKSGTNVLSLDPGTTGNGNTMRVVIERMCSNATDIRSCLRATWTLSDDVTEDSTMTHEIPPLMLAAAASVDTFYYRVTVRVDGPKNAVSFAQTIFQR
jgi:hypothetical protein